MRSVQTDFLCVYSILQMAITINVLPNGYYSYKSQFMLHTLISSVILNTAIVIELQLLG
jgi:hypothetical protein